MKTTGGAMRWWLAVGVLVAAMLAAPAAADCSNCANIGGLTCKQGPPSYSGQRGFAPQQFQYSCLGDAGYDCTHKRNTLKADDPKQSCCSCYLYAGLAAHATTPIFTNKKIASNTHVLVIPRSPCKGVESWDNRNVCPGDAIWSYGFNELKNANKQDLYGMAINPVERRGQHQMHVHLAEVKKPLRDTIKQIYSSSHHTGYLDCNGASHIQACNVVPTSVPFNPDRHLTVKIVKANDPASATPFATVYGTNPRVTTSQTACTDAVCRSSALVWQVAPGHFAVVSNPTGPAEGMLTGV